MRSLRRGPGRVGRRSAGAGARRWTLAWLGALVLAPGSADAVSGLGDPVRYDALPSGGFYTSMGASAAGEAFVFDRTDSRVLRYGRDGRLELSWPVPDVGPSLDQASIAVSPAGSVFALDRNAAVVRRFSRDGALEATWEATGGGATGPPETLAFTARGEVLVKWLDASRYFSADGRPSRAVRGPAVQAASVAADSRGTTWAVAPGPDPDQAGGVVYGVDARGGERHILGQPVSARDQRFGAGRFAPGPGPGGIATDGSGGLWVAHLGRLQRFSVRTGNALATCAPPGDEVNARAKVAIGAAGRSLYYLGATRVLRFEMTRSAGSACRAAPFRLEDVRARSRGRAGRPGHRLGVTFRATRAGRLGVTVFRLAGGDCPEAGRLEGCVRNRRLLETTTSIARGRGVVVLHRPHGRWRPGRYAIRLGGDDRRGNISGTRVVRVRLRAG